MKQLLLFLIPIILISCGNPKQDSGQQDSIGAVSVKSVKKVLKEGDSLQSIINANIHNQPVIDTICMGFTFSMTEKQALQHFTQLIKEKKLVKSDDGKYFEYPLSFELIKANAIIAPEFHDGKLYQLSLVIKAADDMATEQTVYLQVATSYMKKYSSYNLYQEADLIDANDKQFHWVKNNMHIFLHKSIEGAIVTYTNLPVEELIKRDKVVSKDSSKTQTSKDI